MNLVSIVVPVYNVENYLEDCITSLVNQDYKNLEIILIDDGSTDSSADICDRYAELDDRILVLHKENGGLSDARNMGLRNATGKYVTFVDSDDTVDSTYVSYLYDLLVSENAELSICEFNYVDEKKHRINHPLDDGRKMVMNQKEAIVHLLKQKPYSNSASGKLFKMADFEGVEFPYGQLYEDTATVYKLFLRADKVVFGARALYNYLYREGSLSKQKFNLKQMDATKSTERMTNDILRVYPDLKEETVCRLFDPYIGLFRMIQKSDYPEAYSQIYSKIKSLRWTVLFSKATTNKRRFFALISFLDERLFRSVLLKIR